MRELEQDSARIVHAASGAIESAVDALGLAPDDRDLKRGATVRAPSSSIAGTVELDLRAISEY